MRPACPYCGSWDFGIGASTEVMQLNREPEVWMRAICKQCGAAGPRGKTKKEAQDKFTRRYGLAQDFVRAMRVVHQLDPMVLEDMVAIRYVCSDEMADDEYVQVSGEEETKMADVGLIGWLNGIFGRLTGGLAVATVQDDDSSIKNLTVVEVDDGKVTPLPATRELG